MKKILFLLLICIIKLNAYEYLFYENNSVEQGYLNGYRWFYTIENNNLYIKQQNLITGDITLDRNFRYYYFNRIRLNDRRFINNDTFKDYYKNDLVFLNDLLLNATNQLMNYFYNEQNFDDTNHIIYDNYELLYNSDGLAVESIVNGAWAGLYDDNEKRRSGRLYSRTGELLYLNGVEVEHASLYDVINELLVVSVMEVFGIYSRAAVYAIYFIILMVLGGVILAVYLVTGSMDNTGSRGGARWVATFTANGVRKSRWHRFDPDNYHYQTGDRNFSSWRDYQDYERGLSNGTRSPIRKRRIF